MSVPPPAPLGGTTNVVSALWASACALVGSLGATVLGPLIIKRYETHLVRLRERDLRTPEFDYRKEELKAASEVREMMVDDYRDMRERVRATEAELSRLRTEVARLQLFESRARELETEIAHLRECEAEGLGAGRRGAGYTP